MSLLILACGLIVACSSHRNRDYNCVEQVLLGSDLGRPVFGVSLEEVSREGHVIRR